MRLTEDGAKLSDGYLRFLRHDYGIHGWIAPPHELDMAAFLTVFCKTRRFEAPLDLTKGQLIKPPQLRPLWS